MKYSIPDNHFFTQCVSLRCLSTSWTAHCRITPKKCNLEKTVNFTVFLCFSLFLCSEVANLLSNLMICIFSRIGTYFCHVPYTCCSKYGRFCLFCGILNVNVNVDWNNSVEKTCCFFLLPLSPPPLPPSPPPPLPPSPSNKAGWAYRSKLLRDKISYKIGGTQGFWSEHYHTFKQHTNLSCATFSLLTFIEPRGGKFTPGLHFAA